MSPISSLEPIIIDLIKSAIDLFNGNDEQSIAFLCGVLGSSEDNKTRIAIALEKVKAQLELGKVW